MGGLEPPTLALWVLRSNQLSYTTNSFLFVTLLLQQQSFFITKYIGEAG